LRRKTIKKMAEIDWKALQIVANVSTSVRRGDEAGGFRERTRRLSAH
jgi:hypothetical protein